jgi:glycosyltransferase involved in cell wall biosynthesis
METNQNIMVVAHKLLHQPDDDLVEYLNRQGVKNVVHVTHAFSEAPDRISRLRWYQRGTLVADRQGKDCRAWSEPAVYAKEMCATVRGLCRPPGHWDWYIGMDGLCVLFGLVGRGLGRVDRVAYWAVDFVPRGRFGSQQWKEAIYHRVNLWGYRHADEMWDLGPRMAEARAAEFGVKLSDYRCHRVVPYGLWLDRIQYCSVAETEPDTLVFMGHLLEKQGVQLVLAALPELLKKVPGLIFKIIGDGHYRPELERLSQDLGVADHVRFLGKIEKNADLEREISRSMVAVAPYIRSLDIWTVYADPGKIKTYLACGVPVVLTDVPWNASAIQEAECGTVVREDSREIADAVLALLQRERNALYRANAVRFAKSFDWAAIFGALPV